MSQVEILRVFLNLCKQKKLRKAKSSHHNKSFKTLSSFWIWASFQTQNPCTKAVKFPEARTLQHYAQDMWHYSSIPSSKEPPTIDLRNYSMGNAECPKMWRIVVHVVQTGMTIKDPKYYQFQVSSLDDKSHPRHLMSPPGIKFPSPQIKNWMDILGSLQQLHWLFVLWGKNYHSGEGQVVASNSTPLLAKRKKI